MRGTIKTIGIAGAGTMGQGIAIASALADYNVLLYDIRDDLIERGLESIRQMLDASVKKQKLTEEEKNQALKLITGQREIVELKADLIIEAVIEDLDIKRELFATLEKSNTRESLLVTNTSSIPVTRIGSALKHRDRFAGLHFFNPAHIMKLVEIIRSTSTSDDTISSLKDFTSRLGKVAVLAHDSPGFIVNRVARHFYVESLKLLEEGVSDVATIDALVRSRGFRMGPFELMDLIGVDTNFYVTSSMYEAFHYDPKFRPSRIQEQKVLAGHHGRKTGKGFYDYEKGK